MYKLIKTQDRTLSQKHQEFICDTVADIVNLPTMDKNADDWILAEVGSTAFVIENSSTYMLGNDNEWHKISSENQQIILNTSTGTFDLSDYIQKIDVPIIMADYGINSKAQIVNMNTSIDEKISKSSIVKLDSMADFENLTDKTADWYFIKED